MRSSNPVFSRRGFTRGSQYAGFGTSGGQGAAQQGGNPYAAQGAPYGGQPRNPYDGPRTAGPSSWSRCTPSRPPGRPGPAG